MRFGYIATMACVAIFSGCGGKYEGVSPSQNEALQAISPSATAASSGGFMQKSLDNWLKESWEPIMAEQPTQKDELKEDGTKIVTKTEPTTIDVQTKAPSGEVVTKKANATLITTTTIKPSGESSTTTQTVVVEDDEPFTLQKYVDRWNEYLQKKEKLNEGKPKEPSNVSKLESMPVIGK